MQNVSFRTEGQHGSRGRMCRAVESGEPGLRAESASSETGAETGDEVTGNQCSGDSVLCRGEQSWMAECIQALWSDNS